MENNQKPNHIDNTNKNRLWELAVDYLKDQISKQTNISKDRIRNRDSLDRYGIDSVAIMSMTKAMESDLGKLSKTLFFEYNTVDELAKNSQKSDEEKILLIYEKICKDYVYDDNLISYIQKVDEDIFSLPDWYGRDIDKDWEKNREKHNRRICFELSRYLAKALNELFKDKEDVDICIIWNKNLTHYFVGLTSNDYSLAIDLDDFFRIKDLTRLKTGLTLEGITILEDDKDKFKNVLDKFNEGRNEFAIKRIENKIAETAELEIKDEEKESEEVSFLEKAVEILKEDGLDSQGIFEYMKEIIDISIGKENREKIWKKIDGQNRESTRYIRCVVVNIDGKKYLIDGEEARIRPFDEKEFDEKRTRFVPNKELTRGGFDYYDGK